VFNVRVVQDGPSSHYRWGMMDRDDDEVISSIQRGFLDVIANLDREDEQDLNGSCTDDNSNLTTAARRSRKCWYQAALAMNFPDGFEDDDNFLDPHATSVSAEGNHFYTQCDSFD